MIKNNDALKIVRKVDPRIKSATAREFTEAGNINLMHKISTDNIHENYVLRGVPNRFEASKYDKEIFLHRLINKKLSLPVPKIYLFDKTKDILPFAYILMEYKEGNLASHELCKMSSRDRLRLFGDLGKCLAKLHSIRFKKYGRFFGDRISKYDEKYSKPFDTWQESYLYSFDSYAENLMKAKDIKRGNIPKRKFLDILPDIQRHLAKHIRLITSKNGPTLIHDDFRLFNILIKKKKGWKITAILDFEMAKVGVPEYELCMLPFIWKKDNPLRLTKEGKAFVNGYSRVSRRKIDVINCRKIYAPSSLFMEVSYDFYHDVNYKEFASVTKNYYRIIRYILGRISLREFKSKLGRSSCQPR